jgi:hypothetical protein
MAGQEEFEPEIGLPFSSSSPLDFLRKGSICEDTTLGQLADSVDSPP